MSLQFKGFISFHSISFRLTIKKIYKPAHGSLIKMTPKCCGMEGKVKRGAESAQAVKSVCTFYCFSLFPSSNVSRRGPETLRGLLCGADVRTLAADPRSPVGLKGARFRSITVTLWLRWDLGSLEAGSKPLEPCHVLWAVTDWYSWSARTHQSEEGRVTKMTVVLPLDGDTGRRRAWSTGNVTVAGAMGVNHDSHHPTETFSLSPVCAQRLERWVSTWLDSWERNLEVMDEMWTFERHASVKI